MSLKPKKQKKPSSSNSPDTIQPEIGTLGHYNLTTRNRTPNRLIYSATILAAILILSVTLRLWKADLNVPFAYEFRDMQRGGENLDPNGSGDALFFSYTFTKSIRDNGWIYTNPYVGMPNGLDMRDYPLADGLHLLLIKIIGYFTRTFGENVNLFFLLTFPLTAVTSLYVFRKLNLPDAPAFCFSILYAFLPYHFLRGEQHLYLASYYMVPPMVLVILWVLQDEKFVELGQVNKPFGLGITRSGVISLIICFLVGSAGVYYALFGCQFLIFSSLLAFYRQRSIRRLIIPGFFVGVIFLSLLINFSPCLYFRFTHGTNPMTTFRVPSEAETHGLKIIQLLLPVRQHRLQAFSDFATSYFAQAPLSAENSTACLGIIGASGFILLVAWQLGFRWRNARENFVTNLSFLNLIGLLVATIGGLSSVFAFAVSPIVRGYNRMSIYLAFLGFCTLAVLWEKIQQRFAFNLSKPTTYGFCFLFLILGLADQTTPAFEPLYKQSASSYQSDEEFVSKIQSVMPKGAMIFQLPYWPFPEIKPDGDYQQFRGYLHSNSLRWSYGSMKGRETDALVRNEILSVQDLGSIIRNIRKFGFLGIYVDRQYFPQHEQVEAGLKEQVDPNPIVSRNQRLAFYNLMGTNR